ncbi:RNA-binding protein 48 [Achroia grisella]|uniref:RNA-binding protein 48 n=1 Tax=Achroia grisella TaxID=688607 RepID=UPI0027D2D9AF|nr:RNA-binding protein 48 [Achroia grisella]
MTTETEKKTLLSHHVQQKLCTTRLPYRQGRKLTAVKVYTINNESNHLLIFGVPSLNLRQETKSLFAKFGKLLQFNITSHESEQFTETYHAKYEQIQSARVAKRMLDTKNFYGGSLHVCYAPELEDINETKHKLMQRKQNVLFRLRNMNNDVVVEKNKVEIDNEKVYCNKIVLNMGEVNTINMSNEPVVTKKRKIKQNITIEKHFKPCFVNENRDNDSSTTKVRNNDNECSYSNDRNEINENSGNDNIEIVDCTSIDNEIVSNIDEGLSYKKFGNEVIRKVPVKPLNVIKFNVTSKKS